MTPEQSPPGSTASGIVGAAGELTDSIRECADQIERERRLPAPLVRAMAQAGLFRMCIPKSLGGGEVDVATMIRAIEAIARADGSAGWCVMIGSTSGVIGAYLPEDAAREIYAEPNVVTGGVFAPRGRAVAESGGYRVSGRWPFASGCQHCQWLMGGCVVVENGGVRQLPGGVPDARMMLFAAASAEIIDTWSVSGLRGTGSHDIAVEDLFVPDSRSVSLLSDRPRHPGPLFAFPVFGLLALGIAGVALGIARSAIEELVRLAGAKTPTGARKRLAERAAIQTQVAEAEAGLRSARAFLLETTGDAWDAARAEGVISLEQRALLRLAATHTATVAAGVVDRMYSAGGGTSVYETSPLQRQFRDIHVVTQHLMVAPATYELTGRIFLGVGTDTTML